MTGSWTYSTNDKHLEHQHRIWQWMPRWSSRQGIWPRLCSVRLETVWIFCQSRAGTRSRKGFLWYLRENVECHPWSFVPAKLVIRARNRMRYPRKAQSAQNVHNYRCQHSCWSRGSDDPSSKRIDGSNDSGVFEEVCTFCSFYRIAGRSYPYRLHACHFVASAFYLQRRCYRRCHLGWVQMSSKAAPGRMFCVCERVRARWSEKQKSCLPSPQEPCQDQLSKLKNNCSRPKGQARWMVLAASATRHSNRPGQARRWIAAMNRRSLRSRAIRLQRISSPESVQASGSVVDWRCCYACKRETPAAESAGKKPKEE